MTTCFNDKKNENDKLSPKIALTVVIAVVVATTASLFSHSGFVIADQAFGQSESNDKDNNTNNREITSSTTMTEDTKDSVNYPNFIDCI